MHFIEWKLRLLIQISVTFVPKGSVNNMSELIQITSWRQSVEPIGFPSLSPVVGNTLLCHVSSWTIQGLEVGQCLCNFATAVTRVYSAWGNVHPSPKSRENGMFSWILLYWSFLMYRHFCNQWVVRFLCMRLTVWCTGYFSWRRHQMKTVSALLAICAVKSPAQRPVTRNFDVFFDPHPNKRFSKQWWGWWFETLSCPLWRHRNVSTVSGHVINVAASVWSLVCVNVDWCFISYLRSQSFFQ